MHRSFFFALAIFLSHSALAVDWFVDQSTGDDLMNDGLTPDTPFATVTQALQVAGDLDVIVVGAGTYSASSGESMPLRFMQGSLTVRGAGPYQTVFDGEAQEQVMSIDLGDTADLTVEALAIVNGSSPIGAGLFVADPRRVELTDLRLESNIGSIGGGFHAQINLNSDTDIVVRDCTFVSNEAAIGPGIHLQQNGLGAHDALIDRTTLSGHNRSAITVSRNDGESRVSLRNSIVDAGRQLAVDGRLNELEVINSTLVGTSRLLDFDDNLTVVNSIVLGIDEGQRVIEGSGGTIRDSIVSPLNIDEHIPGPNVFDEDPRLTQRFRLTEDSPARDRGDDSVVTDGERDIDGDLRVFGNETAGGALGLVDLGADEYDPTVLFGSGFESLPR